MSAVGRHRFPSTRWSIVLEASRGDSSEAAREALATLCEIYWYPLYAYVRRRGYDAEDARDLTQGFFMRLLERERPLRPQRDRGLFRSYLLGALKHYLADEQDRRHARKRGGGSPLLRLDFAEGANRYRQEPADAQTPESIYERRWALAVLEAALRRLEEEYERRGRADLFHNLKPTLVGEGRRGDYATLSRALSMSEEALKVAAHRLRRRYREVLRAVVGRTVVTPSQIDDELRHLLKILGA